LLLLPAIALAHPPQNAHLPPTKATADLNAARKQMDSARSELVKAGKYACCIKAPEHSTVPGCDLCARMNGSCRCGANLAAGKGVCGECLSGWKSGRGAMKGVKPESVTLLDSSHQKMDPADLPTTTALAAARETLNRAKRTLVKEGRFACCVGKGGCDECAYETSCPCGQEASRGTAGAGICGQCLDGWSAGIGRLAGMSAGQMKLAQESHGMAGMEMVDMTMGGLPMDRAASGTSWQPDATPMFGSMRHSGRWSLVTHFNAFLSYDRQEGPRGDYQYNSTNWAMLMADRTFGKDTLTLRGMLSLEPLTVTPGGYPLLFQTGEQYHGQPLVDRQHPHDLFMELAAKYTHSLGRDSAAFVYVAPSGEPALGPTAFPHRLSAADNPIAPISHHWLDGTHIDFGVLTAGAWLNRTQIEASYFTGREPDEHRYDLSPMHPDSYSGRVSFNPNPNWSLQASYGYIHSPEALNPGQDVRRTTVSASYAHPLRNGGFAAAMLAYGNNSASGVNSDAVLLEGDLHLNPHNTLFGRYELVYKLGEELNLAPADERYEIGQLTVGYVRDFMAGRSYDLGAGFALTFNFVPGALQPIYSSAPDGLWLFLRIRPRAMHQEKMATE
jgi:hypothetical protein